MPSYTQGRWFQKRCLLYGSDSFWKFLGEINQCKESSMKGETTDKMSSNTDILFSNATFPCNISRSLGLQVRDRRVGGGGHIPHQYFYNYKELVRKSVLCPPNIESLIVPPPPPPQSQSFSPVPAGTAAQRVCLFTKMQYSVLFQNILKIVQNTVLGLYIKKKIPGENCLLNRALATWFLYNITLSLRS